MPGGLVCSVALCKTNSKKAKESGEKLSFFSFPKDPKIRKEWIRKCSRKDAWQVTNKRICSKHFTSEDFEDALHARIMDTKPKQLKKSAVPSLHLLDGQETHKESERSKRMMRKKGKNIVKELITAEKPPLNIIETADQTKPQGETWRIDLSDTPSSSTETDYAILKRKCEALQNENLWLKEKIVGHENQTKLLQQHILVVENQLKKDRIDFEEKIKIAFKDFLTSNQIEIVLKKKSKARWTQEELSKAFTLRYFSKRAYIYLRSTLHYPLPGLSTLQQWAANLNLTNGILEDVLNVMEIAGKIKPDRFKATVLSYDEVKVSSLYEYYQKDDEIMGPHSYLQVVMARGLFANWKQPVYIGFDQKMTKEILENVITCLHNIQYNVVACVSDCGGGNQGLWKSMGVNEQQLFVKHPVTKKAVYFFADVPHVLKLLRNWFLDTGFVLQDNTVINKNPVQSLLQNTSSEINACYKLTPLHLNCERVERQNVKLAAQLFSNTTATALKHYIPGEDKKASAAVGDFCQLVNNWFDIMNSYSPSTSIPTKRPYGTELTLQDDFLNEMLSTVSGMVCIGKTSRQMFQRGIIMSTKALQSLYRDMKEEYAVQYILTHRLNQDCLENFFSQIRTRGGLHDHPSPLNAIYRIRMILLGKNPGLVTTHSNIESSPDIAKDEYLLASTLKQAKLGNIKIADENVQDQLSVQLDEKIESDSTSSSTSSAHSRDSLRQQSEKDGLAYIAGYLAKKHKEKHPDLGEYTYKTKESINLHSYSHPPSWIQHLSFGGLIQPSDKLLGHVTQMDKYFEKLHKNDFKFKKNVVKKTADYILSKVEEIPKVLITSFCRQRVFVRIKFLNVKREETKATKRKASDTLRKQIKKIKKIVN